MSAEADGIATEVATKTPDAFGDGIKSASRETRCQMKEIVS